MKNKKTFEILSLLEELSSGREINVKNYAIKTEISERTIRRYFEEIKLFFGEHVIVQSARGNYFSSSKEIFSKILPLNFEETAEQDKLINLLHVINPGFSSFLPDEYKKVDDKIKKELYKVFLIRGSPTEDSIEKECFTKIARAIRFRNYCDISYEDINYKKVKPVKIIYCKGNWQLAIIHHHNGNKELKILRLGFVKSVKIHSYTFNNDEKIESFILNSQTFLDVYGVEPFEAIVAISPDIYKYFKRKKFMHSQKILETLPNGWIKISYYITHIDIVLMFATRWFPNMIILSPKKASKKFKQMVQEYNKNLEIF